MAGAVDWTAFRAQFPVAQRWICLDHAAVAPLSEAARLALADYAADLAANGDAYLGRWVGRVEEVRKRAAWLLGTAPANVAFVPNTSAGLGLVAEGWPWQPGDNVIIAAEEYPANVYPWLNLAGRGVEVRRVPTRDRRILIDDVRALMDARTRIVSLSWVEFASGFRNDLDALGQLCRERGAAFCVDAIQGLGVLPIAVDQSPIDFLAADGHKWLLGPEGAGLFYVRPERLNDLRPLGVGWNSVVKATDFSTIDFRLKPHAGRYEGGSLNVAGISALGASLDLLLTAGIPAVWERVRGLTDHLCAAAAARGWDVYSSRRNGEQSGIVSVAFPGRELAGVVRRCKAAGVVLNVRAGRVRFSPHAYNTPEELDRAVAVLAEVLESGS